MKNERMKLGASFIKVICNTCRDTNGAKIIYSLHKGYESQGAKAVTSGEIEHAKGIAINHENTTGHETRLIEGQLEGRIYP